MTIPDYKKPSRAGQPLVVEYRKGVGNPPAYGTRWLPLYDVKVDRIEINAGTRPSMAVIWFPTLRWNESPDVAIGDTIRIRTDEPKTENRTIVFVGYAVKRPLEFSGGTEKPGAGFERTAFVCLDQRWVLATSQIHFGQLARGPDDFDKDTGDPLNDSDTRLNAQRTVFNPKGLHNLDETDEESDKWPPFPLFCNPGGTNAKYWTARDMIRFLLHPSWLTIQRYCPIDDPATITGLEVMMAQGKVSPEDAQNWGKILYNIVIDGLNVIEAVGLVCKHIGWNFRLDYTNDGKTSFAFYKVGIRDAAYRSNSPVITHNLYAPAVGESVSTAVREGNKMLWSMSLDQDITQVINKPIAIGAPDKFEFTAELVPGWKDFYLTLPADLDELYFTDAELQKETNPDLLFYYTNYHSRGIAHNAGADLCNVGRKWVLNESGFYTDIVPDPDDGKHHYDRGKAFEWKDVLPHDHILLIDTKKGKTKRVYAQYDRQLLPCLTVNQDGFGSVGIKLEFSFDSGTTWQVIPCSVRLLSGESGIFIDEPNLAEIVDKKEGQFAGGALYGMPINLFTCLCEDRYYNSIYKDRFRAENDNDPPKLPWRTRVRVTACVQMDQRVIAVGIPSLSSGSPFDQSQLYDWSDKYGFAKRTTSSVFSSGFLGANEYDSQKLAEAHVDSIRKNNEDMSISGRFTLERLWLGDGTGEPTFMIGDSLGTIAGREYPLDLLTYNGGKVSPEIIQIVYLPETQKQVLITRDLRYAEFHLE